MAMIKKRLKDVTLSTSDIHYITMQLGELIRKPDKRRKFIYLYLQQIAIPIADVKNGIQMKSVRTATPFKCLRTNCRTGETTKMGWGEDEEERKATHEAALSVLKKANKDSADSI